MLFDEILNKIIYSDNYTASDGTGLLGMEYDVNHIFDSSEIFDVKNINLTGDNKCMFNINLEVSPSVNELEKIDLELESCLDFISYSYFFCKSVDGSDNECVVRYITVAAGDEADGSFYVSGKITIGGPIYEQLIRLINE